MNVDAKVKGEIFRRDYPQIIAVNRHQATVLPVRLEYDADGYEAGRVLGQRTSGPNDGLFAKYDGGGASGLDTAAAVLLDPIGAEEFPSTTGTLLARGVFSGSLYKDKLVGLDSNAETDLDARTIKDASGVEILKF